MAGFVGKLFGQKQPTVPTPSGGGNSGSSATINAMQNLSEREEQLDKKKMLLERKINEEMEKARTFTREKKKSQALMCLKKKKMYEQQLERLDALVSRVMEQKHMLEEQQTTLGVLSSMQAAAKAQKKTMQEMKIENIDNTLEEIQEVGDQMRAINEAVAQPVGLMGEMDDEDLLGELADLEQEELDSELLQPAPVPTQRVPASGQALPSAPTAAAKAKAKTQEELELEALQAEMAL
ncbi:MAG: component of the ESCRT-III complex [Monoraphidium minutum]|nr:MAG: component of the ESCRT-III complex [Monoraphidium minutum]